MQYGGEVNMRKLLAVICLVCFFSMGIAGCNAEVSKDSEDNTEKYNAYIEMSNHVTGWLWLCFKEYFEIYGSDKELDIAALKEAGNFDPENPARFPIVQGMYDTADKVLEYTKKEPIFEEADPAMAAFLGELKKTYDRMNELDQYYTAKTYKTDNFEGAKELHKHFVAQTKVMLSKYDTFDASFKKIADEVVKRELENYKQEGYLSMYYALKCMDSAEALQKFFIIKEITDDNLLEVDLAEYRPLYTVLQTNSRDYLNYIQSNDGKEEQKGYKVIQSEDFLRDLKTAVASAEDILVIAEAKDLHAADHRNDTRVTTGEIVPIEIFNEYLSRMIDDYNKIIGMQ